MYDSECGYLHFIGKKILIHHYGYYTAESNRGYFSYHTVYVIININDIISITMTTLTIINNIKYLDVWCGKYQYVNWYNILIINNMLPVALNQMSKCEYN